MKVRDLRFDFANVEARWTSEPNAVTCLFDSLSVCFPLGEGFFIRSVKKSAARLNDAEIDKIAQEFIAQESLHTREHRAYNQRLRDEGYDIDHLEREQARIIKWIEKTHGERGSLCMTACLEHLTGILAEQLASDPAYLELADPTVRDLWTWHALEEVEHCDVAYDMLMRDPPGYFSRAWTMLLATYFFFDIALRNYSAIAKKSGIRGGTFALLKYLLASPGLLRRCTLPYLKWYEPGFHPRTGVGRTPVAELRLRFDRRLEREAA